MSIQVMLFGQLTDLTGTRSLKIAEVKDTEGLQQKLHALYPALAAASYRIAVDKKMINGNTALPKGTSVALLPPFSGG